MFEIPFLGGAHINWFLDIRFLNGVQVYIFVRLECETVYFIPSVY